MRRRRKSSNRLIFTLVPAAAASIAAGGWAIARLLGRRQTPSRAIIPISGTSPLMIRPTSADETGNPVHAVEYRPPETRTGAAGVKETGQITKNPQEKRATAEAPARDTAQAFYTAGHALRPDHALENQPESYITMFVLLVPFLVLAAAIILLAMNHTPVQSAVIVPGGDVNRGQAAVQSWGCGSCHSIPGIQGADGKVGPELSGLNNRSFIAGHLQNTPDNMILWIMHPQQVSPGVDMPDTGVPASVARDMASFLYSINK